MNLHRKQLFRAKRENRDVVKIANFNVKLLKSKAEVRTKLRNIRHERLLLQKTKINADKNFISEERYLI